MSKQHLTTQEWKASGRRTVINLGVWTLGWLISLVLVAFGPEMFWDYETSLTVIALVINLTAGAGMIWANRTHLKTLDEMQQKITSDAMAATLGVGLVAGVSYELLEDIKLMGSEPEISHLIVLMSITYMIALLNGHRKFK